MSDKPHNHVQVRLEFKLADMWVGVFWKAPRWTNGGFTRWDVWVCLVPCLPIHIWQVK